MSIAEETMTERDAYVTGLRQLADFMEQHPDLPVPIAGAHNTFVWSKEALAHIARTKGVRWEKEGSAGYFALVVKFAGGHSYEVNVQRDQVCKRVVIGKRIEPAHEVPEREIEEVRWECESLLDHDEVTA